jgi:hypothetical protein
MMSTRERQLIGAAVELAFASNLIPRFSSEFCSGAFRLAHVALELTGEPPFEWGNFMTAAEALEAFDGRGS